MSNLVDLLKRCKQNDSEAINIIVKRFSNKAQELAEAITGNTHLAEDVVQESFFSAFQRLDQLRDDAAFPGWFRQIVRTQANRIVRKRREQLLPMTIETSDKNLSPLEELECKEIKHIIRKALSQLPAINRKTAELFYLEEYKQVEIASIFGVPQGTIKRRLYDARQQLREMMLGPAKTQEID